MPTTFAALLGKMDDVQWFRMIICFLPGLVIVKLFGSVGNTTVGNWISTVFLVGGVALYVLWGPIRRVVDRQDHSLEEDDGVMVGAEPAFATTRDAIEQATSYQLQMLEELRVLCVEEESRSAKLIAFEISANPQLSYAEATQVALRRYKLVG